MTKRGSDESNVNADDISDCRLVMITEKKNVFNVDVEGEWEKTVKNNNNTTIT